MFVVKQLVKGVVLVYSIVAFYVIVMFMILHRALMARRRADTWRIHTKKHHIVRARCA